MVERLRTQVNRGRDRDIVVKLTMSQVTTIDGEASIRAACLAGDLAGATTATLRRYGPEVLGFLVGVYRDETAAEEAFSVLSERIWRGIGTFKWNSSMRTWLYTLARNALADVRRDSARYRQKHTSAGSAPISEVAAQVRTETLTHLRTETRSAINRLRDELDEEDRALLVLRVDRELSWRDIAEVLCSDPQEEQLTREAARLRKRFQFVKDRLRTLARERGLL
jgi:RNA polymerase sigma-70 factor (ECF subfamily)